MIYERNTLHTMWFLPPHLGMVTNMKSVLLLWARMEPCGGADQFG